jgi:glycosyltransferase involved in cell wall biosynthesis
MPGSLFDSNNLNSALMDLSIIFPTHNEGAEFVHETIKSIDSTCDVDFEIIIIDDYSDVPITGDGIVKVIRQPKNMGVGAAFDTGVKHALSNNIFLMGCDIRFIANNWASRMFDEINKHPQSLICTSTVHLSAGSPELTFEMSRQNFVYNGATILMAYGKEDWNILRAEWLPRESRMLKKGIELATKNLAPYNVHPSDTECYEIPCILGAAYGVKKDWYNYIDGFWGHRKWGSLEPYISLKSWLFGGNCLTAPHIETGHIFNDTQGRHGTGFEYLAYNSMLVAWLLFDEDDRTWLIRHLRNHEWVDEAKHLIELYKPEILETRNEYLGKMKMSIREFVTKFNIPF